MEKETRYRVSYQDIDRDPDLWRRQILPNGLQVLESGGLIIFPTETSYLLGGNAFNAGTMERLRRLKKRPGRQNLSVMCASIKAAERWTIWNETARRFGEKHLPGALTVIVRVREGVQQYASTGQTLGIRIPGHIYLLDMMEKIDFPVTCTSANYHGGPEPYEVTQCVSPVDMVWDAGKLSPNPPSTIVSFAENSPHVIRQGAVPVDGLIS